MSSSLGKVTLGSALSLLVAACATAQWTVVDLHPAGQSNSFAEGAGGFGFAAGGVNGLYGRAYIWNPTPVDVTPATASGAMIWETNGIQSVGTAIVNGTRTAGLWNGTASFVSLAPNRSQASEAFGIYNNRQVGYSQHARAQFPSAAMWSGSSQGMVDLHPQGWTQGSFCYDIFNDTQVGIAATAAFPGSHACRWANTKQSFVDMHPSGFDGSVPIGVHGTTAVGYTYNVDPNTNGQMNRRAWLWNTTGGTGVDMHPFGGWAESQMVDVTTGAAVGRVFNVDGTSYAWFWNLYTGLYVNLHDKLTGFGSYDRSSARAVWTDGARYEIAGSARDIATGQSHAILWKYTPQNP